MLIGLHTSAVATGRPRSGAEAPDPAPAAAPVFTAGPVVAGTGTIGTLLVVSAQATGAPAPLLSFQWRRDGVPIPGAGGPAYEPTPEDDRAEIHCRVSATNSAGQVSADSPAVIARHVAPVAGQMGDWAFAQGTGARTINSAAAFTGAALSYALTGPAAVAIDAGTGLVTVSTDQTFDPAPVTVSAQNSGGAAEITFTVAVLAADTDEETATVISFDTLSRRFDETTARFDGSVALAAAGFDSTVLRFDSDAARFDGFVPDAAPATGFDSTALRFDMTAVRFDGTYFAAAPVTTRFDSAAILFDSTSDRFDAAEITPDGGAEDAPAVTQTPSYEEAA